MVKLYTLILFLAISLSVMAQERLIQGSVTDENGSGIPGVTVAIKGTTIGTFTDINGNYKITMNQGILRFSFVGFAAKEISITNQTTVNVVLVEEIKGLNEVVVIGYGAQKKKDLSTAVAVVGEKEIKDRPIVSAGQALQGKAAGVQVVQPSGKPGVGLSVRVRGSTSITANNEPLYVVDGVPTKDISGLSPSDISSMSILKDASSASIYGARAANGVVIITTKGGESNKQVVSLNTYFGVSRLRKTIDVLKTKQYRDLMEEMFPGKYDPTWTGYTNWSEEVFGTGFEQSYQLSSSGGTEKSRYYISGGYMSQQGIVKPARFDRYSVRLNLDNEPVKWFKIGTNINVTSNRTKDAPDNLSSGRGGVIMSTLNTPPFLQIYKDDGSGAYAPNPYQSSWENPVAYMYGADQEALDYKVLGSIYASIQPIKDLFIKTKAGIDLNNHQWDYYLDPYKTNWGRQNIGVGQADKSNNRTWLWENTMDYNKVIGNHVISGMVGSSIEKNRYHNSYLYGTHFPDDLNVVTLNAANDISGATHMSEWALVSFFGRAMYSLNNKYYLTASIRRDGSSRLAHPWGTNPSFSVAWRISSEEFMKSIPYLDDLKIRGGWGMTGNEDGIPEYSQYGLKTYFRDENSSRPGFFQSSMGNPDLRWETTKQTNLGFDLTMFNARVILNLDAYVKNTYDLIMNVEWPTTVNLPELKTNGGEMQNKGIEFNLSTVNIDKEVRWSTDLNMSFNRNKFVYSKYGKIANSGEIYSTGEKANIRKEGLPIGSFYGYIADGVDPTTGDMIYRDLNNNGRFDPGDRTVIGNPHPDFIYGFTNNLTYKRWDLNIFIQGSQGNDIYNATRVDLEGMFDSKNQSVAVLDRWTPENPETDIPRATPGIYYNVKPSTRFVEDGSYLRLKSITLNYRILEKGGKIKGIQRVAVYVTGQNLLTFTKYSGFDPEVNAYGNNAVNLGVDYGTYPQARSLVVGFNVEF